jgi:hypothetical protein
MTYVELVDTAFHSAPENGPALYTLTLDLSTSLTTSTLQPYDFSKRWLDPSLTMMFWKAEVNAFNSSRLST